MQNGRKKPYPKQLITAEEITAIMERSADVEDIRRSREVAKAYKARETDKENICLTLLWNDFDFMCMLSNIYQAGRIQGIREERLKKRV